MSVDRGSRSQPVAGRAGLDHRLGQGPAQPGHQGLQRVRRGGGHLCRPQAIDQLAGGDQLAGLQGQHDQQRAQPRPGHLDDLLRVAVGADLQRPEHRDLHRLNCARPDGDPGAYRVEISSGSGTGVAADRVRARTGRGADLPGPGLPPGRRRWSTTWRRASSSAGSSAGTLEALPGIGATTAQVITEAAAGQQPGYLTRLLGGAAAAWSTADDLRVGAARRLPHPFGLIGRRQPARWRWPRRPGRSGTSGSR